MFSLLATLFENIFFTKQSDERGYLEELALAGDVSQLKTISQSQKLPLNLLFILVKNGHGSGLKEFSELRLERLPPDYEDLSESAFSLRCVAARSGNVDTLKYIYEQAWALFGNPLPSRNREEVLQAAVTGGNQDCIRFAWDQPQDPIPERCWFVDSPGDVRDPWYLCAEKACEHASLETLRFIRKGLILPGATEVTPCPWYRETISRLARRKQTGDVRAFLDYLYKEDSGPDICPWDSSSTLRAVENGNIPFLEYLRDNQEFLKKKLGVDNLWDPNTLLWACREAASLQILKLVYEGSGLRWSSQAVRYLLFAGNLTTLEYARSQGCHVKLKHLEDLRWWHGDCRHKNTSCSHLQVYEWVATHIFPGSLLPPL